MGPADCHLTQALEPLYTEGEPIEPYEWAGANADQYDPEANNAWGDLPMFVSCSASLRCSLSGNLFRNSCGVMASIPHYCSRSYTKGVFSEQLCLVERNAAIVDLLGALGSFALQREDITDPDDEFRGLAPKSLSKSCDKDGSCEPEENAWAYLPDVEVRFSCDGHGLCA